MVVESGAVVTNPEGQPKGTYIELKLQNVENPIGVSSLQIYDQLTADYKSSLPTIEEIEAQLKDKEI